MKLLLLPLTIVISVLCSCTNKSGSSHQENKEVVKTETNTDIPHAKIPASSGIPRILFVGNSHTEYYVSMPILFKELCTYNDRPIIIDKLITMGVDIDEIYKNHQKEADVDFAKTDADGNYYEIVVLQEKTPVAREQLDKYKADVKMMVDKIRKNSPQSAIYIFEGMAYIPYKDSVEFEKETKIIQQNALAVARENKNVGIFRVGDAIKDAYEDQEGYIAQPNGKDHLRFGENTLHLLNDGGFLESVLLYATLFNEQPNIPTQMTFSTGTDDAHQMDKMPIESAITAPLAIVHIALKNK